MPIRTLLVDDDPLVRTGLNLLLASAADIEVVGEAGDGAEAVTAAGTGGVDIVLMDLRMPNVDGLTATRSIRALPAPPSVIVLTTWDVDDAVIAAIEAGASGFLLKTSAPAEIIAAMRAVMAGDAVLSPRSTRQLIDQLRRSPGTRQRREAERLVRGLTARERAVAVEVATGATNAVIGQHLYLSEATVKTHIAAIQLKLAVPNRTVIAVVAERAGLLIDP